MKHYLVPVSGGKDSQVVLSMAVKSYGPENVTAVHNSTGYDHSLTYAHLEWMRTFYQVEMATAHNPRYKDIYDLIEKRLMIPGRLARLCTSEFKIIAFNIWLKQWTKTPYEDLVVLMGMRALESQNRMNKYGKLEAADVFSFRDLNPGKIPKRYQDITVQLPIVDKSTPWVFQYLRKAKEKVNPLYARGHKRVGCYPCLLSGPRDWTLAARDPEGRANMMRINQLKKKIILLKEIKDPTKVLEHDIDALLARLDDDPFGFYKVPDDPPGFEGGCQWCSQ